MYWVGVGLESIWGLPENHRFYPAAFHHDAEDDAYSLFIGKIGWSDIKDPPLGYLELVRFEYERILETPNFDAKKYFADSNLKFYRSCLKLARNDPYYVFLANMFYKIVRINSYFELL